MKNVSEENNGDRFYNCVGCPEHSINLEYQTAWGKPLTELQKKINAGLEAEEKVDYCAYFERYFNKNFPMRKKPCRYQMEIAESNR